MDLRWSPKTGTFLLFNLWEACALSSGQFTLCIIANSGFLYLCPKLKEDSDEIERQEINVNVIKFNFHVLLITIALRAIFIWEKIVFIIDVEYL